MPQISLLVVINGPVAKAGSIPNLSNNNGIKVPISEAMIITEIKAMVTMIPIMNSTLYAGTPYSLPHHEPGLLLSYFEL